VTDDLVLLHQIRVASPCSAFWEEMEGDDRVRFCADCRLNVYNLSAMGASEAAALVREREGRLCVHYYERPDGTMLTRDCPVGFRAMRRRLLARMAVLVGGLATLFGWEARWRNWLVRSHAYLAVGDSPRYTMGMVASPADPGDSPNPSPP
jgi:hypothetical protein